MKTLTTLSTLLFFLVLTPKITFSTNSKKNNDTLNCLIIKGRVTNAEAGDIKECKVELITPSGVIETLMLKNSKKQFRFILHRNSYYAIRISKPGYVSRLISVNTDFPMDVDDICEFAFNTDLLTIAESEKLNKDALDFPIAIIHFDFTHEHFIHNREYTNNIKREIYQNPETVNSRIYAAAEAN